MREFIEAGLSENPEPEGRKGETEGKEGGGRARESLCRAPAPTYFRKKDSRVAILWEETMFDLTRRWRREMQRFSITTDGHHSVIFTCFPCDRSSDKKAHVTC